MSRKRPKPDAPPAKPKPVPEGTLKHRALASLEAARDALAPKDAPKNAPGATNPKASPKIQRPVGPAVKLADDGGWKPDRDKELWSVAMSGVVPLAAKQSGAVRAAGGPKAASDRSGKMRRAYAEGGESVAVRWCDDGTWEGARKGRAFALEALGRFATPQDRLDLHGCEPIEAYARVLEFVRTRRARGMRVVIVVHGAGKHSPDGTSLLRDATVRALAEPTVASEIDAFRTAERSHGGDGATIIALRAR